MDDNFDFKKLEDQLNLMGMDTVISQAIAENFKNPQAQMLINLGRIVGKMELIGKLSAAISDEIEIMNQITKMYGAKNE